MIQAQQYNFGLDSSAILGESLFSQFWAHRNTFGMMQRLRKEEEPNAEAGV